MKTNLIYTIGQNLGALSLALVVTACGTTYHASNPATASSPRPGAELGLRTQGGTSAAAGGPTSGTTPVVTAGIGPALPSTTAIVSTSSGAPITSPGTPAASPTPVTSPGTPVASPAPVTSPAPSPVPPQGVGRVHVPPGAGFGVQLFETINAPNAVTEVELVNGIPRTFVLRNVGPAVRFLAYDGLNINANALCNIDMQTSHTCTVTVRGTAIHRTEPGRIELRYYIGNIEHFTTIPVRILPGPRTAEFGFFASANSTERLPAVHIGSSPVTVWIEFLGDDVPTSVNSENVNVPASASCEHVIFRRGTRCPVTYYRGQGSSGTIVVGFNYFNTRFTTAIPAYFQ